MIVFSQVAPGEEPFAYQWHSGFGGGNAGVLSRNETEFNEFCEGGNVWGARTGEGDYVGLCYTKYSPGSAELGGLMASRLAKGKGVGTILMHLAAGNFIVMEDPLEQGIEVFARVLKGNKGPRGIIQDQLRFILTKSFVVPEDELPGLQGDDDHMIRYDRFDLHVPDSLVALADWSEAWTGELRDGEEARIILPFDLTLVHWTQVFRAMIDRAARQWAEPESGL